MKMSINEKQLDLLLSKLPDEEEISEIDDTPISDTTTSSSTTSSSSIPTNNVDSRGVSSTGDKTGYPTVSTWSDLVGSKVSRGPANQIKNGKWSDVVGSLLTRGPDNQLQEQIMGTAPSVTYKEDPAEVEKRRVEKQKEVDFNKKFFVVKIPKTDKWNDENVIIPRMINDIQTTYGIFKSPINVDSFFKNWKGYPAYDPYIPDARDLEYILPNGTLRSITIDGYRYTGTLIRISDNPLKYSFNWYYNEDGKPYNQYDYIGADQIPRKYIKQDETWWNKWGQWLLVGGSLLVSLLVPGAAGIWIAIGIDLTAAADILIREGDGVGAGMCAILAFLPVFGRLLKWGRVSTNTATNLIKEIAPLRTEKEILEKIGELEKKSPRDAYLLKQLVKEDPKRLNQIIDNVLAKKITTKEQALNVINTINNGIKSGQITKKTAYSWYKKLGIKNFGYTLAASGFIVGTAAGLKYYLNKIKENNIKNNFKTDLELISASDKLATTIENSNSGDYNSKIVPVLEKYYEKYGNDEKTINRFYKISVGVMESYIKSPNQNFDQVGNNIDLNIKN